jgi:ABC-2 type transport system permease protein
MRAFVALVRREYLQHRGAFLYAPLILIGVVTFLIAASFVSGRYHYYASGPVPGTGYRLFDTLYLGISALWGGYLFIALFFYFADAFNADRRNNQMFFWKSMPRTDFSILMSKLTAGLTILPLLVYFALPLLALPDLGSTVTAYLQVSATALGYLVVLLLWYAPFFAWVGALSTVVGRWSIPLALLIPVVISLFEGVIDFGSAPGGSYLLTFLRERLSFSFDIGALQAAVLANQPIDVPGLLSRLVATTNWLSLVLGLVFAVVVIWAASEYRRRRVLKG